MRILLLTYGIGRGGELTERNLTKFYMALNNFYDVDFVYIFNSHCHQLKLVSQMPASVIEKDFWTPRASACLEQSKKFRDVHRDGFVAVSNLLQQFEMLEAGYEIAREEKYDFVVYIRDDILFSPGCLLKSVDQAIRREKVWFSAFHGNNGYCERVGLLPRKNFEALSRFAFLNDYYSEMEHLQYVLRKGINGEWIYRFIIDGQDDDFLCSYVKTSRIREGGVRVPERVVPRPWHYASEVKIFGGVLRYYLGLK